MRARTRSLCRATFALASGVFILTLSCDTALARCSIIHFKFKFGETSATSIIADSGQPCNIKLREGSGTIIKSIATITRPARGSVTAPNPVNVTYRSRSGFQGEDRFVFAIIGTKYGVSGRATVSVNVSVAAGSGGTSQIATTGVTRTEPRKTASRAAAQPTGLRLQCLKRAGASQDPATKRWTFFVTERDAMGRIDDFRMCLAGGDRQKAKSIAVPERWVQ